MTFSSLITGLALTTDYGERTGPIDRFIYHHAAGTSLAVLLDLAQPGGRTVSFSYGIKDKNLVGVVDEDKRPKTSGSISFDGRAVTAEVCNQTASPNWAISEESFDTLARVIADTATRYNFPIDNDHVLAHCELYERFGVGYATSCPVELYQRKSELLALARHYQAGVVPTPPPIRRNRTMEIYSNTDQGGMCYLFSEENWQVVGDPAEAKHIALALYGSESAKKVNGYQINWLKARVEANRAASAKAVAEAVKAALAPAPTQPPTQP